MSLWRLEWRLFRRARANLWLLLLLFVLTSLGAIGGVTRVAAVRAAQADAVQADRDSFARKRAQLLDVQSGRLTPGQFGSPAKAHQAILIANRPLFPPRAELGVLSGAESRQTPDILPVGIGTRYKDRQPSLDDPSNRLDGAFDISFVATWLLPLFALLLGFDVLARDRETGVAALLASQGASLARVGLVRLAIRLAALIAVVGGVASIAVIGSDHAHLRSDLIPLAIWLLALLLSIAFWLALAAGVNATSRSSAAAALFLLTLWVAIALAVPALVGGIVGILAPAPDRLRSIIALRAIETDLTQHRAEVTRAYYDANPGNRPLVAGDEYEHYFVTEMYPRTLAFDRRFAPLAQAEDQARVRQARTMRLASVLSPSLALKLLTEDLAGGAPERRVAFLASADDFQARWRRHFDHKMASMTALTLRDYDRKPEFRPRSEQPAARWARIGRLLAALLLPVSIAVAWGANALRRAGPL